MSEADFHAAGYGDTLWPVYSWLRANPGRHQLAAVARAVGLTHAAVADAAWHLCGRALVRETQPVPTGLRYLYV